MKSVFRPLRRIRKMGRRLYSDQRGAVGLMFGLAIVPLIAITGGAIDYSRASAVRASLQAATDAAALTLARDGANITNAEAQARGRAAFNGNWTSPYGAEVSNFTITRSSDQFQIQATVKLPTMLFQLVGAKELDISAESTAAWGLDKIEIALALDNTGSMAAQNRMVELKRALCGVETCTDLNPTTGFVAAMNKAATFDNQIRVALVPFDTNVRVPLAVQAAVNAGTAVNSTFAPTGAGFCNSNPTVGRRIAWSLPGGGSHSWFRLADRDRGTTGMNSGCEMAARPTIATWDGCLWDRDLTGDRDTTPLGVDPNHIETLHPAVRCRVASLGRMMPLVDIRTHRTQIITALAAMQPSGNTNVGLGAVWGTNMLIPGAPMSTAASGEPRLHRFLILLTDGDNTETRSSMTRAVMDARTEMACNAAKAQGIVVYSIRVIQGNRDMLRRCATTVSHYYEVTNAAQLTAVFEAIAGRISGIRLVN